MTTFCKAEIGRFDFFLWLLDLCLYFAENIQERHGAPENLVRAEREG